MIDPSFVHVQYSEMADTFLAILLQQGLSPDKAKICTDVFAVNSLEGIYTHGVNRFPRFVQYVKSGYIKIDQEAQPRSVIGCMEQWDGQLGPGPINALLCTTRSMKIAKVNGLGCVALANTNHWMRGGYYGGYAARKGFVFIGWTNTMGNMPAWGAVDPKLGNNPLVIAVPYKNHVIILDMAMSQYSYGSLELYALKNEKLPVPGGFDLDGNLTTDAASIIKSRNVLPIGYWKGAGMSLLLDILATILSGGLSTAQVSQLPAEQSVSQVFMTIDISKLSNFPAIEKTIQQILDDYHSSVPQDNTKHVRYPGEHLQAIREKNLKEGIPVLKKVWNEIQSIRN